jgi:hypothetical protein
MCPFHAHFKHFQRPEAKEFQQYGKVSSIMPTDAGQVTIF